MRMNRDIDQLISALQSTYPAIAVEQLRVRHPGADDDGVWFFTHPSGRGEVQVESSTGQAPFIVESDCEPPATVGSLGEAAALVAARLGLSTGTA